MGEPRPDATDHHGLRTEFEAADGSFLIKLRGDMCWDKDAFNHLTRQMVGFIREREARGEMDAPIPRWIAEGFWFLDDWVRDWSRHEDFPRPHGSAYHEAAYHRLHLLAVWLFTGSAGDARGDADVSANL